MASAALAAFNRAGNQQDQIDEVSLDDSQDGALTSLTAPEDAASASQRLRMSAAEAKKLLRGSFAFNRAKSEAHSASPSRFHVGGLAVSVSPHVPLSATPPHILGAPSPVETPPPSTQAPSSRVAEKNDGIGEDDLLAEYVPTFLPPAGSHLPPLPVNDAERFEILADSSAVFNWQLTDAGRERAYRDLFTIYDGDTNGMLDAMEMCELLEALGFDTGSNVGRKQMLQSSSDQAVSDQVEDVRLFTDCEHPDWFRLFVSRHGRHAGSRGASCLDRERTFTYVEFTAAVRALDPVLKDPEMQAEAPAAAAAACLMSKRCVI